MKRFLILLISSCAIHLCYAQEEIILDSIHAIHREVKPVMLSPEKSSVLDDSFSIKEFNPVDKFLFHQPLLPNYNQNLDFSKYLQASKLLGESLTFNSFGFSPFYLSGAVFNQKTYRLSDRLVVGGSSFGAQSVLDRPKMNPTIQDMSVKGASMFFQYKVSDKFKVETRVSVSNHQLPFEP